MNKVLETTRFVIKNAESVKINKNALADFCNNFSDSPVHWLKNAPFDINSLQEKDKLNFLLVLDSISFCYWGEPKWAVEYNGKNFDGAFGMIAAIGKAVENKIPVLDSAFLAKLDSASLESIFKGNVQIPLFRERLNIFNEIGRITSSKFSGDFGNLVKQANGDSLKLLELIVSNFSSFEDSSSFNGKKIFFYKRAQLLVHDIFQAFEGEKYGALKNIGELTVPADYKLPQALRKLGILSYAPELAKKIDSKIEIEKGSNEEIEIRACTIWAIEMMEGQLKEKFPSITALQISDWIWLLSQQKSSGDKPYHRTRTTAY